MRPTVILLGVGHVFAIRDRVKDEIYRARPSVVCLELDELRWNAIMFDRQMALKKGHKVRARWGWPSFQRGELILRFIAWKQGSLAKAFGTSQADEMVAAKEAADAVGAQCRLIDLDTRVLQKRWMGLITRRERAKLFLSAFLSLFATKKKVEAIVKEYLEDDDKMFRELAEAFPRTKTALIDERNDYMARGIERAGAAGPLVLAVIGAGHIPGIRDALVRGGTPLEAIHIINLKELREPSKDGPVPAPTAPSVAEPPSNAEFTATFERAGPPGPP